MKKHYFLTLFLVSFAILSIILSYFLIYDYAAFQDFINKGQTNVSQESNLKKGEVKSPVFYKPNNLSLGEVFKPAKVIYRNDKTTQWITDPKIENSLVQLFTSSPIQMKNAEFIQDEQRIDALYNTNHLQLIFTDKIPANVMQPMVEVVNEEDMKEHIHRMVIPFDDSGQVYFINLDKKGYYTAKLPRQVTHDSLETTLNKQTSMKVDVQGYIGKQGLIYLPNDPIKTKSQLYTLEDIPESVYVKEIFKNNEFKTNDTDDDRVTYFNYLYNLDFQRDKHLLDVRVSRPEEGTRRTTLEKIENSYDNFSRFEFWRDEVRLMNPNANQAVYRRFVNGFPIFPAPDQVDHGAMIFHLKNNQSSEIYRFQIPLQIIQAHIPDMSEPVELLSADQIQTQLKEMGYDLQSMHDIIIAYEIQEDTEDYQKMLLVPKWYVKLKDTYFAFDQLSSDEFKQAWNTANGISSQEEGA